MKFSSFIDIKNKKTIKQLDVLKEVLSKHFEVKPYLEIESPYIFLKSKSRDIDFEGVRIYKIGSSWAYRIQNESETEPYGKAYPLNLEEMFENLVSDMSEEEAGSVIAKALIEEFNNFFNKSSKIQRELGVGGFSRQSIVRNDDDKQKDPTDIPVLVGSNSGDFVNSIYK